MKRKFFLNALLCLILVGFLTSCAEHLFLSRAQEGRPTASHQSEFRYLIFRNGLLHDGRLVFVLLDEKSFSERTLKVLFNLVSKRFPNPDELRIAVYTNLAQIPTPEEEDAEGALSPESKPRPDPSSIRKDRIAVYTRLGGGRVIRIRD